MAKTSDTFLDWVQLHERVWGTEIYPGKPSLEQIMDAPVVTFWRPMHKRDKNLRYKIRLHTSLKDVERYYTKLMFRSGIEQPKETIARIYVEQERYTVQAVRILFKQVT